VLTAHTKNWGAAVGLLPQRLDGAVLEATGRPYPSALGTEGHVLLQRGATPLLDQAFPHCLGQFLAEGKEGLRQPC
jgi:hypothetical protein